VPWPAHRPHLTTPLRSSEIDSQGQPPRLSGGKEENTIDASPSGTFFLCEETVTRKNEAVSRRFHFHCRFPTSNSLQPAEKRREPALILGLRPLTDS
jgi:hypothetical protein